MERAFYGCTNLTLNASDIPDFSGVANMSMEKMFQGATILVDSQDQIGIWDVSNVNDMRSTFAGCNEFDEDISSWQVDNVINFNDLFLNASKFNQNISGWNTGSATSMESMFNGATAFNQDVSGWDIGEVTTMANMFNGATDFSAENYDQQLIGWSTDTSGTPTDGIDDIPTGVTFGAPPASYCNGASARNELETTYNWIIDGGTGLDCTTLSNDEFLSGDFKIYPNPVANTIKVKEINAVSINEVYITNLRGQYKKVNFVRESEELLVIDVSDLATGMYFLKIKDSNNRQYLHKFIKYE